MEFVQPIRDTKKIEDMKRILKARNLRDYCLFVLGINSALRIGDLLRLKIYDVIDEKGKIRDRISTREKKTSKPKDFPISSNLRKAIEEYLTSRKDYSIYEFLFTSRKGDGAIKRQHAWYIMNEAAKAARINERIGTHTLRKTFGYHAYKRGHDITRLQKLLNHSSPSITLAYIGITQDELDNVYISLNL